VYLGTENRPWLNTAAVGEPERRLRRSRGLPGVLRAGERQTLALLGTQRPRQGPPLINTLAGATRQHAGSITLGGVALHKLPSHQRAAAGIGWVPQERNIFKSLTVHENLTAVARPGPLDAGARLRDVPAPGRAQDQPGHAAVRRRAADAGRGPRAGGEPEAAAAGRAAGRPGAHHRQRTAAGHLAHHALEGLSAIIVEQHPQAILAISDQAIVLDHGTVVHADTAAALRAAPELLDRLLGVAR
jgi:branched-chain amino acid transport system ATP-binding protein